MSFDNNSGYERNGSLVVLDTARGYFGPKSDILLFLKGHKIKVESDALFLQIWVC
jgi:hypothetical protein